MKKNRIRYITSVAGVIIFCAVVIWFVIAINSAGNATRVQQMETVRSTVENGKTLCYSIEGAYPATLSYLTENYGVNYDESRYIIHYDCFAANVRPSVTIIEKER